MKNELNFKNIILTWCQPEPAICIMHQKVTCFFGGKKKASVDVVENFSYTIGDNVSSCDAAHDEEGVHC